MSFHPTGHTHNECDQCASRSQFPALVNAPDDGCRISIGVKHHTILCKCQFADVIRHSYTPKPEIEWIGYTMDWKTLVKACPSSVNANNE
jgi:hypothetical protein